MKLDAREDLFKEFKITMLLVVKVVLLYETDTKPKLNEIKHLSIEHHWSAICVAHIVRNLLWW